VRTDDEGNRWRELREARILLPELNRKHETPDQEPGVSSCCGYSPVSFSRSACSASSDASELAGSSDSEPELYSPESSEAVFSASATCFLWASQRSWASE